MRRPCVLFTLLFACSSADGGSIAADALPADALPADALPADARAEVADAGASFDASASGGDAGALGIAAFDQDLMDSARRREVGARVVYPRGTKGPHAVVLISHGGFGAANGETLFAHLGEALASAGFVAVQIGHRRSSTNAQNRVDRPADVSFLLDALTSGALTMPADFEGRLDTREVGHTGHSAGAYTAHAVAGAAYPYGMFRDARVAAIAPISPQGVGDEFEAFDRGPADSTWTPVSLPTFVLLGADELSTNGVGVFIEQDWRLRPFTRYTDAADRLQVIISGQAHTDMGAQGADDVKAYIARSVTDFFDVYLRGGADACAVGATAPPAAGLAAFERRPAAVGSRLERCP